MTKKLIHYDFTDAGYLHCDECHHDLSQSLPFNESLIGYRCPVCSADMLTRKDYDDTVKFFRRIDWLNKWFGWLGREKNDPRNEIVSAKLHNGRIEVRRS